MQRCASYSHHRSRDGTGVVTNRGTSIWWAKREIVKVRVAENYLSLIPVSHHPSFVATTVKTVMGGRGVGKSRLGIGGSVGISHL